jgi:hypothetical protein
MWYDMQISFVNYIIMASPSNVYLWSITFIEMQQLR